MTNSVGAQSGSSAVYQLKGLVAKVDDDTRFADNNLKKLAAYWFVALALQRDKGYIRIENKSEFRCKVERVKPILVENHNS